jgi:pilus assembly protein CpaE
MSELPKRLNFEAAQSRGGAGDGAVHRVGVVDGAIGGEERFSSIAALFPTVAFESVGPAWPDRSARPLDVLITRVDAGDAEQIEAAIARLGAKPRTARVVVVLRDADVVTTRRLLREGAADVLPAPVSEATLAVCLERLLATEAAPPTHERSSSEVVGFIKGGGGVGATALAVQTSAMLASRPDRHVCLADFDLQFGAAALYLDLPEAISVADCLGAGAGLEDTPFGSALARHRTGARVLAAPRDLMPLESMGQTEVEALINGLRRDFDLTILDLPSVWTAWTNRALHLADRIVLVTQLSVPHVHMVKRQLRVLEAQQLDDKPLTLVCNALNADQQSSLPLKSAERALGRSFDIVIPEDRRLMNAAINQGLPIASIRRGAKIERAIQTLAGVVAQAAATQQRRARL